MKKNKDSGATATNFYYRETSPFQGMELWGEKEFSSIEAARKAADEFKKDHTGENFWSITIKKTK